MKWKDKEWTVIAELYEPSLYKNKVIKPQFI